MCASNMFAWLVLVTIARAEVFVTHYGQRLGNAYSALYRSAFPYAIRHGCILRLADDIEEKEFDTSRAYAVYNSHDPSGQAVPLSERFFNFTQGQPEPPACNVKASARDWYVNLSPVDRSQPLVRREEASEHELHEAKRALDRVFGTNSTHAFGRDCRAAPPYLAAHVRSGDISYGNWDEDGGWRSGKVHAGYGQPSLSYYVNCIAAARRDGVKRMIVLCEDFRNTVCLALRTMAPVVDGLSVRRLVLLETLQTLGCASRVCTAVGTFSRIAQNSYHNRNFTVPQKTDISFPAAPTARDDASSHTDGELWPSRNITRRWWNTCLQREGMLLR